MKNDNLETKYIWFFGLRLIFRNDDGKWKYHGWYNPNLNKVI